MGEGQTVVDVSAIVSELQGYATLALGAGVAIGTALIAWRFVKRFLRP